MAISQETLELAIDAISAVEKVKMDADSLAEDVYITSCAFSDEAEFKKAISETVRAQKHAIRHLFQTC